MTKQQLEQIYTNHYEEFIIFATQYKDKLNLPEDVVQIVFTKLFAHLDKDTNSLNHIKNIITYVKSSIRNQQIDDHRKVKNHKLVPISELDNQKQIPIPIKIKTNNKKELDIFIDQALNYYFPDRTKGED